MNELKTNSTKDKVIEREDFNKIKAETNRIGIYMGEIVSGSMLPLIKIGGLVKIFPCQIKDLKKFDIIVFYQKKILICHYVWHFSRFNPNEVITRALVGGEDMPVNQEDILGIVLNYKISKFQRFKILSARLFRRA